MRSIYGLKPVGFPPYATSSLNTYLKQSNCELYMNPDKKIALIPR